MPEAQARPVQAGAAPPPRVLLVDDDASARDGVRLLLAARRPGWQIRVAPSAEAALALLAEAPADVVVSDISMPGMDGIDLLADVAARRPETLRVILSGESGRQVQLRALTVAHRHLAKPCEPALLLATLDRAVQLRRQLRARPLLTLAAGLSRLPSPPPLLARLRHELADERAGPARIAAALEQDPGLTARVLQIANSTWFGAHGPVGSVRAAVLRLGLDNLRPILLSAAIVAAYEGGRAPLDLPLIWGHSLAVAGLAGTVAAMEGGSRAVQEAAFTAGLLHEVGAVILAAEKPPAHYAIQRRLRAGEGPRAAVERAELGATTAEVGALLLNLWGIPDAVVEPVARHLEPAEPDAAPDLATLAVHVADWIDGLRGGRLPPARLDETLVLSLAPRERLAAWRALARKGLAGAA